MSQSQKKLKLIFTAIPKFIFHFILDSLNVFALILKAKIHGKDYFIVSHFERFGDILASEPILRKISTEKRDLFKIWIVNKKLINLATSYPYNYKIIPIKYFDEWVFLKKILNKSKIADLNPMGKYELFNFSLPSNPNNKNINKDNYYHHGNLLHMFGLSYSIDSTQAPAFPLDENIKLPVDISLPYVVLHTSSEEAERNWNPEEWAKLISYFLKEGFQLYEIGNKSLKIQSEKLIFIPKLSIPETALLIKNASFFIGIDSGPAHLANAVGTYGIILLGKYRDYGKYMPYSGNYQNGTNATIIHYPERLSKMKFSEIRPTLDAIIHKFKV